MHSVSLISRFMNEPCILHYAAAKRVLRYLQGTRKPGILYKKEEDNKLVGYIEYLVLEQILFHGVQKIEDRGIIFR